MATPATKIEVRPAEVRAAEVRPAEAKPAEVKVEVAAAQAKPVEVARVAAAEAPAAAIKPASAGREFLKASGYRSLGLMIRTKPFVYAGGLGLGFMIAGFAAYATVSLLQYWFVDSLKKAGVSSENANAIFMIVGMIIFIVIGYFVLQYFRKKAAMEVPNV